METINKYESVFLESPRDESGILLNRCFDIVNNKLVPFAVNPNHIDAFIPYLKSMLRILKTFLMNYTHGLGVSALLMIGLNRALTS